MKAAELTRALGGRWCGSYGIARCPAHEDRTPSLSLRDGERGLLLKCFSGCSSGDVVDSLRALGLWPDRAQHDASEPKPPRQSAAAAMRYEAGRTAAALRIWAEAREPRGTVAECYLGSRGLDLGDDIAGRVLRYHPRLWHQESQASWPGMVALLTDLRTDRPTGVHRIFVAPDGSGKAPIEKPKKMLGRAAHSAVKLDGDESVTLGLVVAEGIETGLAAQALGFRPCWALGSAGAIEQLPILGGIEALTICGEVDESGANARASRVCADRWLAAGAEVSIVEPDAGDMNDVLQARAAS
jgi:putative DNA primase/helicase